MILLTLFFPIEFFITIVTENPKRKIDAENAETDVALK
jgi:hypothetical protein